MRSTIVGIGIKEEKDRVKNVSFLLLVMQTISEPGNIPSKSMFNTINSRDVSNFVLRYFYYRQKNGRKTVRVDEG